MHNHGERHTLSTRVADMDRIVPAQMGVTAAVLENVIFCHQDDSLWPMAEPQKLKEKFDKIFDAQKYTKAIENMIKLRKAQKDELGKLVIHEANNKLIKEKADRAQNKLITLEAEIDSLRDRIEECSTNIRLASEEAKEKKIASNKALGTVEELRTKKDRADGYQSFIETLKADLEELQESDEWLQSTLDQYEDRMEQYHHQSQEYQSKYSEIHQSLVLSRRSSAEKQSERGLHQAEKNSYENQIKTRFQLIKEAASSFKMSGYDRDLDENKACEFAERIQQLAYEKESELEHIRTKINDELLQIQKEISNLENLKAIRIQEKVNAKDIIGANEMRIRLRQKEVDEIHTDEGAKAALEASLFDIKQLLDDTTAEFQVMDWDKRLNTEYCKLKELELEASRLRDELFESNKLAKDQAALEYAKTQAKTAQKALDAMIDTYNDQIIPMIHQNWKPESLEKDFHALLDQKSQAFSEAKKNQDDAEGELRNHEFQLKTQRNSLMKKVEEMEKCEKFVLSSITSAANEPLKDVENFIEELNAIQQERNELQQDLGGMSIVRDYYQKSLVTIQEQNCCRLCERTFTDQSEKAFAEEKLLRLLKRYDEKHARQDLRNLEEDLKKANAARPHYETYRILKNEDIPSLEKEIKLLEAEKVKLISACEKLDMTVHDKSAEKRDVEILGNVINDIVKYHKEKVKYENEIAKLSSQKKSLSDCQTVEEIQEKSTVCEEELRALRKNVDNLTDDKNRAKSEIASLEIESGNLSQKLNSAQFQLEKKKSLISNIEELRESSRQQREAMRGADDELNSLLPQFSKAKALHDDIRRRGESKLKEAQAEKDKLAQSINKIKLVEKAINEYIHDGGLQKLAACEEEISQIERNQQMIESELDRVSQKANELNSRINDSEKIKRSIVSNIRYRKSLRDLESTNREIQVLQRRIITEDADRLVQEHLAAEKRTQNLMGERGPLVGQMSAKDAEFSALIKEWETDYKDAGQKYREIHIKVETTKAAIEDVIKCTHAIDNAIMKYHTLKMEEINSIAGELWTSTYQGTDIDTIMIRSESDNNSNSAKRNYNYRLCMMKQDAELDMRGRCSAGQRVLASIIIRLALAECFGVSCGVSQLKV